MKTPFYAVITDSALIISWEINGIINYSVLSSAICIALEIRRMATTIYLQIHSAFIRQFTIAVKHIIEDAHDFTDFRDVAELFSQIKQNLFYVYNDGIVRYKA